MKGPTCALSSGDPDHKEEVTTKLHPPQFLRSRPSSGLDLWGGETHGEPRCAPEDGISPASLGPQTFSSLTPSHVPQDYTWEDHGYSLIQRLYPEGGQLLDEKFQAAYSLTYNTIAMHSGVDTSMLRRAIWNYIHCVFGIRLVQDQGMSVLQALNLSSQLFPFSVCLSFPFFLPILFFKANIFLC